ncbi:MAG: hypothetical protein PF692_05470 [Kiritimatiellae bacterium]|jgi:hypothetical protein|nr:hypothetical protein [Kiritimatiellia bacterium]
MKRPEEIKINRFQLKVLLNDNQKEGFDYIVNHNVYCGNCGGTFNQGVEINGMVLDSLNDVRIEGACKNCQGKVARVIEFGEDKEYYQKAMDFRKSIGK